VTGKTSLIGGLNDSNLHFYDQNEGDNFVVSPMSRRVKNLEGNFTDIVTRRESETTHFLNNGGFKLISIV